jgi:hypothetical protein
MKRNRKTFDMAGTRADNAAILRYNNAAREGRVCPERRCEEITIVPGDFVPSKGVYCEECWEAIQWDRYRAMRWQPDCA